MPQTLELPQPLKDDINEEAAREGVSPNDHATLLLYIAAAFHERGKNASPFQKAVKEFMNAHALDAEQIASVTDELIRVCLTAPTGSGKTEVALLAADAASLTEGPNTVLLVLPPLEVMTQRIGRINRARVAGEASPAEPSGWPDDFFEETYGSLADDPLERLPQGEYEKRTPLK